VTDRRLHPISRFLAWFITSAPVACFFWFAITVWAVLVADWMSGWKFGFVYNQSFVMILVMMTIMIPILLKVPAWSEDEVDWEALEQKREMERKAWKWITSFFRKSNI